MEPKLWYAVQIGEDDHSWSCGSYDEEKAFKLAKGIADDNPEILISIATFEVYPGPIFKERRIVKAGE